MSNCTPCTPANDELPIFCDPFPATDTAKRLLVEDEAFCQKALTSPTTPSSLVWDNGIKWKSAANSFDEFTNFKSTGTTTARNLVTRFGDTISVKDFGAVGDGVTDDTIAIQNAINSGKSIYFPIGNYVVNGNISVSNKPIAITGEHPIKSSIWFNSSSAGFTIYAASFTNSVLIQNIQLWKKGSSTSDSAIKINGSIIGTIVQGVQIQNVNILGPWLYGCWFDTVAASACINLVIDCSQSHTQACIRITGDSYENTFMNCYAYSSITGFLIEGTSEGIYIDSCSIINVLNGIVKTHSSGAEPWLSVKGTHINANSRCIKLERTLQTSISNCLFYAGIGNSGPKTGWIGVEITTAYNEDIIISNNIFNGLTYPSSMIGVSIDPGERIIIHSNTFNSTITGILAGSGCNNSKFYDNTYFLLSNNVLNTNTSNSHYFSEGESLTVNNTANGLKITGRTAGLSPAIQATGSDANLNINLVTKGSGLLSYGTFQSQADTPISGFITILDAAGTPRKLAVIV